MWPFNTKSAKEDSSNVNLSPSNALIARDEFELKIEESFKVDKSLDWFNYQMSQGDLGNFGDEFQQVISKNVLKAAACKELDISKCVNAISRQFFNARFAVSGTDGDILQNHPLAMALNAAVYGESAGAFHQMRIFDLIATGEAFAWIVKIGNDIRLVSMQSERVDRVFKNNVLESYEYSKNQGKGIIYSPDNVIDIKLPNPFSRYIGMSVLISLLMEILTRKYGKEWVLGFFLRGGNSASVIETETSDLNALVRLMATLNQLTGSRRNMHNDKILPKGAKVSARQNGFKDAEIINLLKQNSRDIWGMLGVPPVVVGDTEAVNYATSQSQMQLFWKSTILPYQAIYCGSFMQNSIVKSMLTPGQNLVIDNCQNEYLDRFDQKLTQDTSLASILTIDERRERLGYGPIGDGRGVKLSVEIGGLTAIEPVKTMESKSAESESSENIDRPAGSQFVKMNNDSIPDVLSRMQAEESATPEQTTVLKNEVQEWEKITLQMLDKSREECHKIIAGRNVAWGEKWSKAVLDDAISCWDSSLSWVEKPDTKTLIGIKKDDAQDAADRLAKLRERALDFLSRRVAADAEGSFVGFSQTWTQRIYSAIETMIANGYSLTDVASNLKRTFSEYYEGQMKTVVNTETRSAMALGVARFGVDLQTSAKRYGKVWLTKIDGGTRDSHASIDNLMVSGENSDNISEMSFISGITLRHPHDGAAPAGETINCRCVMRYKVLEWGN